MTRVKRGPIARKRRDKILKIASGFRGASSTLFRVANQHALKGLKRSYFDRKAKKRNFRSIWIARINAGVRNNNFHCQNYHSFMHKLNRASVALNRKTLATLVIKDYYAFLQLQKFINISNQS